MMPNTATTSAVAFDTAPNMAMTLALAGIMAPNIGTVSQYHIQKAVHR